MAKIANIAGPLFGGGGFVLGKLLDESKEDGGGTSLSANRVSLNLPDFIKDPKFQEAQDISLSTGKGILSGDLPEFFQGLGQTGSQQFQDMLALINRETTTGVQENLVRRGISRSGVGTSSIARAVADSTTKTSFADFLKASGEKENLLGTGLETISGVRSAGLEFAGQENQFGLKGAELQLGADKFNATLAFKERQEEQARADAKNAMWADILEAGIGALGSIGGMMVGGPPAAMVGGQLGSAAGGAIGGANTGVSAGKTPFLNQFFN